MGFTTGEKFADRYVIIEEIGEGGMGRVFKAKDTILGITVALKLIKPKYSSNPQFIALFKQEALLGRSVSHENVIRIHDIGEKDDIKYISMDYVKGQNLRELIRATGNLTLYTAIKIARQICQALQAAHKTGIIHRDLKPQNIMIDKSCKVYTMDFGLAKIIEPDKPVLSKSIAGTPQYLSPEQAKGTKLDQRSDIYALGLILYEMVTGKSTFNADSVKEYIHKHIYESSPIPSASNPLIPSRLDKIILKCLEKDPDKRYTSMKQIYQDLDKIALPVSKARGKEFFRKLIPWAAIVIVLAAVAYSLLYKRQEIPRTSAAGGKRSIAIMAFENSTGDTSLDHFSRYFQDLLFIKLFQSKYIHLISLEKITSLLEQFRALDSQQYSAKVLSQITQETKNDYFIIACYVLVNDEFNILLKIMDAHNQDIVGTSRFKGKDVEGITPMIDQITPWVKSQLNFTAFELNTDLDEELRNFTTDSKEALIYFLEGRLLFSQNKYNESIEALQKAVSIDKKFAMAYSIMAIVYIYKGYPDEGKKNLLKAIELKDRLSPRERYMIEGDYYNIYEAEYTKAIESYLQLLSIYPKNVQALRRIGSIYRNFEEYEEAEVCFRDAIETDDAWTAFDSLATSFMGQGKYNSASKLIMQNKDKFPDLGFVARTQARIYICQGRIDEALYEAGKAKSQNPEYHINSLLRGHIDLLREKLKDAEESFRKLIDHKYPRVQCQGHYWLGHLFLLGMRPKECRDQIIEGLKLAEKSGLQYWESTFRLLSSYLFLKQKNFDKAITTATQAEALASEIMFYPDIIAAQHFLGLGYIGQNRIDTAEQVADRMKKAIEKSGYVKLKRHYHHLLGKIAREKQQFSEAISHLEKAVLMLSHQINRYDMHAFFIDALASILEENGDIDRAIQQYEKLNTLTFGRLTWGDIYAHGLSRLSELYREIGQTDQANKILSRYLQLKEYANQD